MFQEILQGGKSGSDGSGNFIFFQRDFKSATNKPIYVKINNQDGYITDSITTNPLTISDKFLKFDCDSWSNAAHTRVIALSNVTVSVDFGAYKAYKANDVILDVTNGASSWWHSVVVKN